ncbi:protein decapping 5-like [Andrographis paniculata]|uniref:protein decapping 5-like n=1 Tax=Andrographis paniculata TaxID=175694 RepID=UPI0021E970B1|nr:protein decapping 5-like [Andrographis paniculata]
MAVEGSSAAASARSGGPGGASANSYIGSLISLTSKSEIRYEGILYNINTEESSIGLCNVRSFGTERRNKDGPQVPPSDKIYEYILFRGSDIKDLQVKASPPVQTTPSINSDPAIIQSHYPRPAAPPTTLPPAPTGGALGDLGSHSTQTGLPGSNFQSGVPLYQPGGNLNSWGPAPPNANNSGMAVPMYWQGFYGAPSGLPQLPQQSLLRPPPGLSIPPSMQQMQFSGFNTSLPTTGSSVPGSGLPDYPSLVPNNTSAASLTSSTLPASSLPLNVPPLSSVSLPASETTNLLPNKPLAPTIPSSVQNSSLPPLSALSTSSVPDSVGMPPIGNKSSAAPGPVALPQATASQTVTSASGTSGSVVMESLTPSLITPGQLLQPGPSTASAPQPSQTAMHKDVEIDHVSPTLSVPVATEAQPPILPLPPSTRAYKPNAGTYHMRNHYRGRGGRGLGMSRPVTEFAEEFDFMAMNEKFKKDEVWGHLGKSNRSKSKDKEGNGSDSEEEIPDEDDSELPKIKSKAVYNKDDFFDSLSCNSLDNNPNHGRTRYSEQMKLDTETFGDFSRYHGGRGGRGPGRGGGRFRGSYYGRGNGGYNSYHMGRGRGGRGMPGRAS